MSGEKRDAFDTENKQIVRERLWIPCFKNKFLEINSWKKQIRPIRYLCFPGPNYLFLKYLVEKELIPKESIIIGVESDLGIATKIRPEIKMLLPNYIQYDDFFENIVSNHEGFQEKFPFDIAELDFTKFVLKTTNGEGTLPYIRALDNFFIKQLQNFDREIRIKGFYLTITSNMQIWVFTKTFKEYKGNAIKILLEKELESFNSALNHPYLSDIITKKIPLSKKIKDIIVIMSLILVVMNHAFDYFLIKLINAPICYIGTSSKMVTVVFHCKKKTKAQLGSASYNERIRKENLMNAIDLCKDTDFLLKPSK